jgi:hypothetical protein
MMASFHHRLSKLSLGPSITFPLLLFRRNSQEFERKGGLYLHMLLRKNGMKRPTNTPRIA